MRNLSQSEAAAVFSATIPGFRPDSRGKYRCAATYRNGDNQSALSLDTSNGGRFFDHVTGVGGDLISLIKLQLNTDFKGAHKALTDIIGRDPIAKTDRPRRRFSPEVLTRAARFQVGILWRIESHLKVAKEGLFGPKHDDCATVVRGLTEWEATIRKWSAYEAAENMTQLSKRIPKIVNAAVEEAAESERNLAQAIAGTFSSISEDAAAA